VNSRKASGMSALRRQFLRLPHEHLIDHVLDARDVADDFADIKVRACHLQNALHANPVVQTTDDQRRKMEAGRFQQSALNISLKSCDSEHSL
jgi:hypothetical protein